MEEQQSMGRKLFALSVLGSILFTLGSLVYAAAGQADSAENRQRIIRSSYSLQMPFVANEGQVEDPQVSFYARTFGGSLYVTKEGEMVYRLPMGDGKKSHKTAVLTERLIDQEGIGLKIAPPAGIDPSYVRLNYFTGKDEGKWKTNIAAYNTVSLGEVYKGIKLSLQAHGNNVEKIFTVAPGADYRKIGLRIDNAETIGVNNKGELEVQTAQGVVRFSAPIAYQSQADGQSDHTQETRKYVQVAYRVDKDTYGFMVGDYDKTRTLIIDPTLVYSTYLGGNNDDYNYGSIAVDTAGNAYVVGQTHSTNFPSVNSLYGDQAGFDTFIAKIKADGSALLYSTYLGGNGFDYGYDIAVDKDGNAYVTGWTDSTDFPTTASAFQKSSSGNTDAFVTKINPDGSVLVYSTYLGGSNGSDYGYAITVDQNGNAYITGTTTSNNFPVQSAIYGTAPGGGDVFVTKLNAAGSDLVYSTYLGGSDADEGNGIAVDQSGNAYITGNTASTNFPAVNALYGDRNSWDAFVAKINAEGNALVYSTYLGGDNIDLAYGIIADQGGNAYVTGQTNSSDFPTVNPLYGDQGAGDVFVAKISPTGSSLLYSTYLGGGNDDRGIGLVVDSNGFIYVTGWTESTDFPTLNPIYGSNQGGRDVFVTKLNPTGSSMLYSTYLGGNGQDYAQGRGIALDRNDNVYVAGLTSSTNFPTVNALYGSLQGGQYDSFVTKITVPCITPPSGLISWWGGDNNALDIMGTSNGTLMSGAMYTSGIVGQAFSFDGSGSYMDAGANPAWDFGTQDFTIGFWIKFNDLSGEQTMIEKFTGGSGPGWSFTKLADQRFLFVGAGCTGASSDCLASVPVPLAAATWYYLTVTRSGSLFSLYLDGALQATKSDPGGNFSVPAPLLVGRRNASDGRPFFVKGLIDEVAIFSRSLSADEIAAIYNSGSFGMCRPCTAPPDGMVAWWKGDGNYADAVGTNHGTPAGGADFAAGKVEQAFSFDGAGASVAVPANSAWAFGTADFTIDFWAYSTSFAAYRPLINNRKSGAGDNMWAIEIYSSANMVEFHSGSTIYMQASNPLINSSWNHIAVTRNGGIVSIYINGVLSGSAGAGSNFSQINDLQIGRDIMSGNNLGGSFPGLIDEVEIFNHALSANEIAAIYNAGCAGKCFNPDTTPDTLTFNAVTNADRATLYTSNAIAVSGINVPTAITVTDGEYSIGCTGTFTEASGTILNGQTVCVRQTSSSSCDIMTTARLTIGTSSADFNVTTVPPHTLETHISGTVSVGATVTSTSNTGNLDCTWNGTSMSGTCTTSPICGPVPVTLTATLPAGTIIDWGTGCDSITSTSCTINTLSGNITISPVTTAETHTVTVSGAGVNGGAMVGGSINATWNGNIVQGINTEQVIYGGGPFSVVAAGNDGIYATWSGDCDSTTANGSGSATCTIDAEITSNKDITATFDLYPVWCDGPVEYFMTIWAAYGDGSTAHTIKAHGVELTDSDLNLTGSASVVLDGGYLTDFSSYSGAPTTITGPLTIGGTGSLTVSNIAIK